MNWKQLAAQLRKQAPALSAALAGPAAAAVGGLIATTLGVNATPEAVAKARETDPMADVALAQLDAQMQTARMADTQHARSLIGGHMWGYAVDFLVIALAFFLIYALVFVKDIPDDSRRAFDIVLGAVLGAFGTVVAYWRGSSRGSAEKSVTLNNLADDK